MRLTALDTPGVNVHHDRAHRLRQMCAFVGGSSLTRDRVVENLGLPRQASPAKPRRHTARRSSVNHWAATQLCAGTRANSVGTSEVWTSSFSTSMGARTGASLLSGYEKRWTPRTRPRPSGMSRSRLTKRLSDSASTALHDDPRQGRDPFEDQSLATGLACRLYRTPGGLAGAPTTDQLIQALDEYRQHRVTQNADRALRLGGAFRPASMCGRREASFTNPLDECPGGCAG